MFDLKNQTEEIFAIDSFTIILDAYLLAIHKIG